MLKKSNKNLFLLSFIIILGFNACVFVPFIDSYKNIGVTQGDRQALLPKVLKDFQNNIYWGTYSKALTFVKKESLENVRESFKRYKERKIVSVKTEDIIFSDSSKKATVKSLVKYYEIPYYVVKDENVEEIWNFSLGDWELSKRDILEDEKE